jgi:hypothetical protein
LGISAAIDDRRGIAECAHGRRQVYGERLFVLWFFLLSMWR